MKNLAAFLAGFALILGGALGAFYATTALAGAPGEGSARVAAPAQPPAERQFDVPIVMFGDARTEIHRFVPGTLVVNAGDTVTLTVRNGDVDCVDYPHGFAMPGFGIDIPEIAAGEAETVTFRAEKPGIYPFRCAAEDCAEDHGEQLGQLVVLG